MNAPRFRAAPVDALKPVVLDDLVAVYHRPSGQTHLIVEPAPQILAALQDAALTRDALWARLGEAFDLRGADVAALDARLDELVATGLVAAA